jgi:hypothetical protein
MTQALWPERPLIVNPQNPQKGTSEGFAGAAPTSVSDDAAPAALLVPMASAEPTASKQRGRPFMPGQSGNPSGRPKGAKNKLTDLFLSAITDDFAEHGAEALARVRAQDPASYLKIVGSLVPRELVLQREESPAVDYAELSHDELVELLEAVRKRKFVENALKTI